MDNYRTKYHSKYNLKVHLIFVTKYRKKILNKLGNDVKLIFHEIASKRNYNIIEMEVDKDHIHILLEYNPSKSVTQIVKEFKQLSTYFLWKNHYTYLKLHYWKEKVFWSRGYFACSIGEASTEIIRKYIENQG